MDNVSLFARVTPSLPITVLICAFIAAFGLLFWFRWTARSVTQGPALLTMSGIAGTFLGIATGLWSFNANDIQHSIPGLIDGMKTSVWASLTGVVFAVVLKAKYALSRETESGDEGQSDAEMIASRLQALQRSIIGDDEATVISQMKLARQDMNDRLDALKHSQAEFMERLVEMSSKTLIEALRDVIRDFNQNLTEQFGENFKELNAAVARLVEWQEQYRRQMDELIATERESAQLLRMAVDQHKAALESSQDFLTVAQGFKSILDAADAYKANLKANTEQLASLIESVRRELPGLRTDVSRLIETVAASVQRNEEEVKRLGSEISERFRAASDAIQNELVNALATANKQITETISKLVGSTKEQTEALQISLEETLNESLRTLGQQLASLSNRFAEDYGPVADRLREIVNATRVA